MTKIIACLGLLFCTVSYGSSLNLIASDDVSINETKTVYLNQYVLFFGEQLSVYNTNTAEFTEIEFEGDLIDDGSGDCCTPPVISYPGVYEFKGQVYFTRTVEQTYINDTRTTTWRTDGTADGTQVSDSESFGGRIINGFGVKPNADYKVLVSNGNNTYLHDIDYDQFEYACVFAIDHIVYINYFEPLIRSQQGTTTELDASFNWALPGLGLPPAVSQTSEDCLVQAGTTGRKIYRVPRTGPVSVLTDIPGLEDAFHVFIFNDRVVAESPNYNQLMLLTKDLQGVDATISLPDNNSYSINSSSPQTGHSLFHYKSRVRNSNSQEIINTLFDFNQNQSIEFQSPFAASLHNTADAEHFFYYTTDQPQNKTGRLVLDVLKNNQSNLDFPANQKVKIINNPNQTKLYALVTDEQTQTSEFYQVVDDIEINDLINGGWHDPNIENQGLNIRKGLRHDGSDYVSVTGYTYRNGQPLWFAGMSELNLPQNTVSMELSEYDGIGLFEAGVTPNKTPFAELEFSLTSCHTLSATIITADETIELNLTRLNDMTYTQNCVD